MSFNPTNPSHFIPRPYAKQRIHPQSDFEVKSDYRGPQLQPPRPPQQLSEIGEIVLDISQPQTFNRYQHQEDPDNTPNNYYHASSGTKSQLGSTNMDSTAYDLSPLLPQQENQYPHPRPLHSSLPPYLQSHNDPNHQYSQYSEVQQQSDPILVEYDQTNPPPYLARLVRISASIHNSISFLPKYPIQYAFLKQAAPRFLSLADAVKLPEALKAVQNCPHLCGTVFTRESMVNTFQQSAKFQRYNNFNHPSTNSSDNQTLDPKYSFSLLAAYNQHHNNINPGKFIILGLSWRQQPLKSLQYQLLHQNHCPGNGHHYPSPAPPAWLGSPRQPLGNDGEPSIDDGMGMIGNTLQGFVYYPPTLYNHEASEQHQSLQYRSSLIPLLCREICSFQPKKSLIHIIPVELSLFQHQTWSQGRKTQKAKRTLPTTEFNQIHNKFNTPSFCSPALLYNAVNGYALSREQRLVLLEKLFHSTVARIVLNSYLQYEIMLTKELKEQQHQQHEQTRFEAASEHIVRYDDPDAHGRYLDDTDAKEDTNPTPVKRAPHLRDLYQNQLNTTPSLPQQPKPLFCPPSQSQPHHHLSQQPKQSISDLDELATFNSTFQASKMIFNHFKTKFVSDYRLGFISRVQFGPFLQQKFQFDSTTPILPFSLLLHTARSHLQNVVMPRVYSSLPIDYLLAMAGLTDPLNFPPLEDRDIQSTTEPLQSSSPLRKPISDSWYGLDESNYGLNDPEGLFMRTHHVVDLQQHIPKPETIHATWQTSASPLSLWFLKTRRLQHQSYSQSLKASVQRDRYNNFFKLKSRYGLSLHEFLKDLNIYDARLYPQEFTSAIKSAQRRLNHVTIESTLRHSVKGGSSQGFKSTSCGIEDKSVLRLFQQFGPRIWLNHTSHKLTALTSSHNNRREDGVGPLLEQKTPFQYYCPIYTLPSAQSSDAPRSLSSNSQLVASANTIASIITHVPSSIAFSLSNQLPPAQPSSLRGLLFGMTSATQVKTLRNFLASKTIPYSPIFPHYPCDSHPFNNIGRCASLLRAMNSAYIHTHLIPRVNFCLTDPRLSPQSFLSAIKNTKLSVPYPQTAPIWRRFFFVQRYENATKRQITAALIRAGRFNGGGSLGSSTNNPVSNSSPPIESSDPISPNAHANDHPQHQDYTARLLWSSDKQFEQQQQDKDRYQRFQTPLPQLQDENVDIGISLQRPPCSLTGTMLQDAKSTLATVFDSCYLNIYEGDTINQHNIRGVFQLLGENNWVYQGNPALLIPHQPVNHNNSLTQFFSNLFK